MFKSGKGLVCLMFAAVFLSSFSFAATQDRIRGELAAGTKVALRPNLRELARPGTDIGRVDGSRLIQGVSLAFRPSPAQQQEIDKLIAELGDPTSPNYHKYLNPKQYGERFGLSQNDIQKVVSWLQSEGFTNIKVAKSRNRITFDGTIAQVESTFATEFHLYLVDGDLHYANARDISVPAAMSESVIGMGNINTFRPKPRARVQPRFTSSSSGRHFLSPGDFATIYNLQPLYDAGIDGTGQTIAVVGQTALITSDIDHFRSASSLPTKNLTQTLIPNTGASTVFSGDLVESDLDLEWSGGIAKNANINFIYVGANQNVSVWDSLQYAVNNNVAPFITTSYGFCEQGLEQQAPGFAATVRTWAQAAILNGQTIVAASGDAGAADCESTSVTSATTGLAVDVPASIPEVTGMGGTEFFGDPDSIPESQYWLGASSGDAISSAKSYIPEEGWNDSGGGLSSTGGGVSTLFSKPSWQTGTGVPNDGQRDVPDVSLTASPNHDGYLFCSQPQQTTDPASCTSGFRDVNGNLDVVGGTSAASPTFAAILALFNQYFGARPGIGFAPINPSLYSFAASNPSVFHDVTTGNNKVPCTTGTTDCPSGTTSIGFTAAAGYDLVTGLGSVNGFSLAQVWSATIPNFSQTSGAFSSPSLAAGNSTTATITVTPHNGFTESVALACSGLPTGATCSFNPSTIPGGSGTSQLTVATAPNMSTGNVSVTASGTSTSRIHQTISNLTVTSTTESFTLSTNPEVTTLSVKQGQTTGAVNLVVGSTSTPSFLINSGSQTALPLTYTCANLPSESTCHFSPGSPSSATAVTLTITTTAPTGRLQWPLGGESKILYAFLLPGLMGFVFTFGSRQRSVKGMRILAMLVVLGFSTMWMASCGGSSGGGNKDPGTPVGTSTVTVNATTGGASPIASSLQFQLSVTQ